MTSHQLTLAQLKVIDHHIDRFPLNAQPRELKEQRDVLLSGLLLRPVSTKISPAAPVKDILFDEDYRWIRIRLPHLATGISNAPGLPGTEGEIFTDVLGRGHVAFNGRLSDSGTTATENWWVSNWHTTVEFPPAPGKGILYFRFHLSARLHAYFPSALSGAMAATLSIMDADDGSIAQSVWPIYETLPLPPGKHGHFNAFVPVEGSALLKKGEKFRLPLVFVAMVGLRSGQVSLGDQTGFGTYAGGYQSHTNAGTLEYKFDPIWWIEATKDLLELHHKLVFPEP